jgi:hypothetical protein
MPPPRIATVLPTPTFGGQSPGRGDKGLPGGGGGAGGTGGDELAADDEPQADSVLVMPIAAIALSIAEPPTARPIDSRNCRLAIGLSFISPPAN